VFVLALTVFCTAARAALPLWTAPPGAKEPSWTVSRGMFRGTMDAVQHARELEGRGAYKAAGKLYRRLARTARDTRNRAWAWLRAGDCFLEAGKTYAAHEAYSKVATEYTLYAPIPHLLAQMRRLAEDFAAGRGTLFGHSSHSTAAEIYEEILRIAPAGPHAAEDMLRLAHHQREAGDLEEAAATYRDLLRRYPQYREAHVELASVLLRLARHGDGDGRLRREAQRHLATYLQTRPTGPSADLARDMLALVHESLGQDLIQLATFYEREPHRRLEASRRYLYDVIRRYPDSAAATIAKAMVMRVDAELAMQPAASAAPPTPARPAPGAAPASPHPPSPAAPATASKPPPKEWAWSPIPEPTAKPKVAPPRPGEAVKWLEYHERVKKYLLPLEDIRAGRETPDGP